MTVRLESSFQCVALRSGRYGGYFSCALVPSMCLLVEAGDGHYYDLSNSFIPLGQRRRHYMKILQIDSSADMRHSK
jgi:hypothetical protein